MSRETGGDRYPPRPNDNSWLILVKCDPNVPTRCCARARSSTAINTCELSTSQNLESVQQTFESTGQKQHCAIRACGRAACMMPICLGSMYIFTSICIYIICLCDCEICVRVCACVRMCVRLYAASPLHRVHGALSEWRNEFGVWIVDCEPRRIVSSF